MVTGETIVTVRLNGNVLSRQGYLQVVDGRDARNGGQISRAMGLQMVSSVGPVVALLALLLFVSARI